VELNKERASEWKFNCRAGNNLGKLLIKKVLVANYALEISKYHYNLDI
jgi:hypothetical protein